MHTNITYSRLNSRVRFTTPRLFYYYKTNSQREHVYLLLHQHAFILEELKIMSSEEKE